MEKKINAQNSIVLQNDNSVFNFFGWPTVVRLPDGTLGMTASGFRVDHVCPFGKVALCYSKNEGQSWSPPSVVIDTPLDDRDGGIAVFGQHKVIVTSFNNTIEFQRNHINLKPEHPRYGLIQSYLDSVDAKASEEKFLGSTYKISEDGGYTFGSLKKAPVSTPHGPCVMPDQSLLYVGRAYGKIGIYNKDARLECHRFTEDGNFEYLSTIEKIDDEYGALLNVEPYCIALPNGKLVVHIRVDRCIDPKSHSYGVFTIYQCESYDGGRTFTKPHTIGLESGAPSHIIRHSCGVLIASYGYRKKPYGQRVAFSYDEGETWDCDYILRDDGPSGDLGYPSTVELKDGSLLTVYYQQPEGKKNCVIMQSIWNLPENVLNNSLRKENVK